MIDLSRIKSGDLLVCDDGYLFIVRDGKVVGPSALMSTGFFGLGMWTIKYQSSTLEVVIKDVEKNHGINKVIRNKFKIFLRILGISL